MKPWWDQWPERLEYEINELKQVGANILDTNKDVNAGLLQVIFTYVLNGSNTTFIVEYPPTYPFTRFELFAPNLDLHHHQNPLLKNLCVLPRRSENWDLAYTVGGFLRDRVGQVLAAATAADTQSASGLEVEQAEPIATYLPYAENSNVLIDSNFRIPPGANNGTFKLGIETVSETTLRGAILELRADDNSMIYLAPDAIGLLYKTTHVFTWSRTKTLPIMLPKAFELALTATKVIGKPAWLYFGSLPVDIRGIVAPDETGWRVTGDTFICLVRVRMDRKGFRPGKYWSTFMVRPDRLPTISVRAPELAPLAEKAVAIVGAGCLGAAAVLEFARAGVREIRIMDDDVVEAGTTIRWPLGLSAAGRHKVIALAEFIAKNYPNVAVRPLVRRFGATQSMGGAKADEIEQFFSDVDAIYDATAEEGISYPLSEEARRRSCTYTAVYGLAGAWGGRVVRIRPATAGCWVCYKLAIDEGVIPTPPSDQKLVQPIGCAEPTFTGANFDMQHITLLGVRASVLYLVQSSANAPTDMSDDIFTLSLRTAAGDPITPYWQSFPLLRHMKCENH
ncbi:MAG: ThiF family adenylyltransferase [Acidobacteriia bacterium]|nr:ThiF family adenylyltransferase [Terriglobia bacterium]